MINYVTMFPNPKPNFWCVLSESRRILRSHPHHFNILSIIFLLPLSSSVLLYPVLFHPTFLFFFLLFLLSLSAFISITYSVFNIFHAQPPSLTSSIKRIFTSFFPLLATRVLSHLIFFSISLLLALVLFPLLTLTSSSSYFLAFSTALFVVALVLAVTYLQVTWTLAPVIVVVESSWGLEPLRKSATLMKRMKGVALCSLLFFVLLEGIFMWSNYLLIMKPVKDSNEIQLEWSSVPPLILNSLLVTLLMLYSIAANTVLYIYCMAIREEEYANANANANANASLAFDHQKIPLVA